MTVKKRVAQKTAKYPQLTKEFVPFDEEGKRYITQVFVDGDKLIYHGDVLLGHAKDLDKMKKQGEIKTEKPQKWTNGKVPYVISNELPNPERVLTAIDFINQKTNVKFVQRNGEDNYVIIKVGEQQCYSNVGMLGGPQLIYLSRGCQSREVLHELMHTLGFFHEQNREDRDDYVEIFWDNIAPEHHTQFKKIPNDFLGIDQRPFDYQSIMLYSSYFFSLYEGEPSMLDLSGNELRPESKYLSEEDIERVNIAYPSVAE